MTRTRRDGGARATLLAPRAVSGLRQAVAR
jgi:hypothetical protein